MARCFGRSIVGEKEQRGEQKDGMEGKVRSQSQRECRCETSTGAGFGCCQKYEEVSEDGSRSAQTSQQSEGVEEIAEAV